MIENDNMESKKITLRKKNEKRGPKPKDKKELSRKKTISWPPRQFEFLCLIDNPSEHMQKLLTADKKYQEYLSQRAG